MHGSWRVAGRALMGGALLALAACAGRTPAAPEAAPPPGVPLRAVAETVGSATEPDGWATAAAARCAPVEPERRPACYEEVLLAVLDAAGIGAAMRTLERLPSSELDLGHHGHLFAHHIGIAGYRGAEQVGAAFGECTAGFQSGCYHGVIQAYFADPQLPAVDTDRLDGLCAAYRGEGGSRWLLFQCVHGIGHGLVALHGNHLPRALEGCDLLSDEWEREGCYGGAFMENVVSATMPHHAPRADHDGHDAAGHDHHHPTPPAPHAHAADQPNAGHPHADHHGAHAHGAAAHASPPADDGYRPLDPSDAHHPCSMLGERYLHACYSMQTSAVLFRSAGDLRPGIELCEGAPERARRVCFTSLGRDVNAYSRQDHAAASTACLEVPVAYQPNCVAGVAKNLVDLTAQPADGLAFCRTLPTGPNRERCFQAVGEQVAVLESAPERRAQACGGLDGADARACRFGAGVAEAAGESAPVR